MSKQTQPWPAAAATAVASILLLLVSALGMSEGAAADRTEAGGAPLRVGPADASEPTTWRPADRVDDPERGQVYRGLKRSARCPGGFEAEGTGGACTAGPDPAPRGVDATDLPSVQELEAAELASGTPSTAAEAGSVPCYGDGVSGKRVQVIYAVAADKTDRFASVVDLIRGYAYTVDRTYYSSAQRDGGIRHIRFVTTPDCTVDVKRVVLSPTGDDSIANTRTELRNVGFTSTDRKYLTFVDAAVYCGISYTSGDSRPDASNPANWTSVVSRIDAGCWPSTNSVPAHELAHALGAVQPDAPNANGAWHCTDEYDRLCYNDGSGQAVQYVCPSSQEAVLDCNGDDYFNVAPKPDSWLATHWNLANSMFLEAAEPGTAVTPSPPPTSSPSPSPTPTVVPSTSPTATPPPTTSPTATPSPTPTATPSPTPTATLVPPPPTVTPTPTPTSSATLTSPPPTSSPSPTTTSSPSPSPSTTTAKPRGGSSGGRGGGGKPPKERTFSGVLTAGDTTDSFRFAADTGQLRATVKSPRGTRLKLTVIARGGRVVLAERGRPTFAEATKVRAGRYKVKVSGPAGTRYTVRVKRVPR